MGFDLVVENPILGYGSGGFEKQLIKRGYEEKSDGIINPHNFFIELITTFGLLGWAFFGFIAFTIFQYFKRVGLRSKKSVDMLIALVMFSLVSIVPATFMFMSLLWIASFIFVAMSMAEKESE